MKLSFSLEKGGVLVEVIDVGGESAPVRLRNPTLREMYRSLVPAALRHCGPSRVPRCRHVHQTIVHTEYTIRTCSHFWGKVAFRLKTATSHGRRPCHARGGDQSLR